MNFNGGLVIAVDFDGTIVEDAYPKIGKPILFAFETLQKLQKEGHRLILWTYRSGDKLDEAVAFCEEHGIFFYAVNKSFPEEEFDGSFSRKINADLFIDDRNIGGFFGWGEIYHLLINSDESPVQTEKKKGFFDFLK
ncbi:BT0820 family HAD-type phosphatase [Confluentibacter flavum]|uniref:Hydrolase n=1 Tax=Confluentibacter flavum TaxID=1909700 RepID=A0A2N3HFL7_9FLAO|nr:hydrolase [Confluentibacter flavum]PKQ43781.1 hydrolase [Confluentibacter flavum]